MNGHTWGPRTANGRQYWVKCSCGWESEDLPAELSVWIKTGRTHVARSTLLETA